MKRSRFNHYTLVQKENQQNPEFQWVYDKDKKNIHSKKLGSAYDFVPHLGDAFDGAKICMEAGGSTPGPSQYFEINTLGCEWANGINEINLWAEMTNMNYAVLKPQERGVLRFRETIETDAMRFTFLQKKTR
ncbi:hypothetical protein G6F37_009031 [Rhizopus arrhizus]|nr:hypothetical protein G6F38_012263 [Rhizopus arrhizus]KAG1154895.1 hypothetical protein G6F37_009031 [Rhizopus arrhizus]